MNCKNCGHPRDMHSDGEYTGVGECCMIINEERDDTSKMEFCDCKEYSPKCEETKK